MNKNKLIEHASLIIGILGLIIMIGASIYDKHNFVYIAGLVGIVAFAVNQSVKKKNQKSK